MLTVLGSNLLAMFMFELISKNNQVLANLMFYKKGLCSYSGRSVNLTYSQKCSIKRNSRLMYVEDKQALNLRRVIYCMSMGKFCVFLKHFEQCIYTGGIG